MRNHYMSVKKNAFKQKKSGQFWFSTATPAFPVNKLRESAFTPEQFTNGVEMAEMNLTDYQSGYLTICNYDPEFQIYALKFPNDEVKFGLLNSLAKAVLGTRDSENPMPARNMVGNLREGKILS